MNTGEIEHILFSHENTHNIFQGVFPSNITPPKTNSYPQAYVFNLDKNTEPGSHWVALYKESATSLHEYFDSYGFPPLRLDFYKYIKDEFFKTSEKTLQNNETNVCGQYTIHFIIERSKNVSFENIINFFTDNTIENDIYIFKKICYESMGKKIANQQCSKNMFECLKKYD